MSIPADAMDRLDEYTDVLVWVDKICSSSDFCRSNRLKQFLRFIVAEALAGRSSRLKAYSIALAVFERPASFDPQVDPLVRIEAGRLRRALERYYATEGRDDALMITVPKGAYVPQFIERSTVASTEAPECHDATSDAHEDATRPTGVPPTTQELRNVRIGIAAALTAVAIMVGLAFVMGQHSRSSVAQRDARPPVIAVMPFVSAASDERAGQLARGISEDLIDNLASFSELRILGRESVRHVASEGSPALWERFNVRYLVEGNVTMSDTGGTLSARLVDALSGQVIWTERYPLTDTADVTHLQLDIGRRLADTIGRPYGVVFRIDAMREQSRALPNWQSYSCVTQFYAYRINHDRDLRDQSTRCLQDLTRSVPDYAGGWAMLAIASLDEVRSGFKSAEARAVALEQFKTAAAFAYLLAPNNLRAIQAEMLSKFFSKNVDEGISLGRRGLAINPNDTDMLGEFGSRLSQAGHYEEGRVLISRALLQDPANASFYYAQLALIDYARGDYASADVMTARSQQLESSMYGFVVALIKAETGDMATARKLYSSFIAARPDFPAMMDTEMQSRNFPADLQARMRATVAKIQGV